MKWYRAITLIFTVMVMVGSGIPAEGGTLDQIRQSGSITLGHREASIPFSYYDDKQQVIGYSHELMLHVLAGIKSRLQLPSIKVNLIPITSANRISLIQNGTVDLECGSTTNNTERQQQVAFSNSIFIVGTRLLTQIGSGIDDFPDLAGKTVVTTAGTTSERLLRKMNTEKNMAMQLVSAKDHGEAFLTLETGRATAFVLDDVLLYGEIAKAKRPGDWRVTGTPQSFEAYGCMMRKGDPAFKNLVDQTLAKVMTSGEAGKLYDKWFLKPIPPKNLNLHFPLSAAMKIIFQAPNDHALDRLPSGSGIRGVWTYSKTTDWSPNSSAAKSTGYRWNWSIFLAPVPSGETSYGFWLLEGLQWTLLLALGAWLLALPVGIGMGVWRTFPGPSSWLAEIYVELFRNVPLLVQLFIWYFVLPELLPTSWGLAVKNWPLLAQQFFAAWLCLGLFTSARVAEQVRAGIQALPTGQAQASLALGLTRLQTYRHVLLPVVLRMIMPPLTSEFLNVFKNSAVATTIGLIELSRQAQQLVDYTAQPYEAFIAVTLLYLMINEVIMLLMGQLEKRTRLPGLLDGGR